MMELRFDRAFQLRNNALSQNFSQFDAPLVEGIDVPDGALCEHGVFVQSNQLSECFRREPIGKDRIRWPVAFEYPVRYEPVRRPFRFDLFGSLAERERFSLGKHVRQKHVVMASQGIERLREGDEVTWDQMGPLVDQLVEGVLAVGPRLTPVNGACLLRYGRSVDRYMLAVALHCQLLKIGGEALQVLLIWQHGGGLSAEKVGVPDSEEAHKHGQIALERRCAEVLIDLMEAVQHGAEVIRPDSNHGREPDR